jgi:hypothetical protein
MKPTILSVICLTFGFSIFCYSLTLPYYKDTKAANTLVANSYDYEKSDYYKEEAQLRTNKLTYMNLGTGIMVASAVILYLLLIARINSLRDLKKLHTPNRKTIIIGSNVVWLLSLPGTYWYYSFRLWRGDYPPFADSIGIPIYMESSFYLVLLIPLNIFLFIATIKTELPTTLFISAKGYNWRKVVLEIFFGFLLLINIILFVTLVYDGDHFFILINLFFTYVILSLRAGNMSRLVS